MNTAGQNSTEESLPGARRDTFRARHALDVQCSACGWSGVLDSSYQLSRAPETVDCGWCHAAIPNPWKLPTAERPAAEAVREPREAVRMSQSGGVNFSAFDPARVRFNYLHEAEATRAGRTRAHERAVRIVFQPLVFMGMLMAGVIAFLLLRPIQTEIPVAAEPIEYVPAGLKSRVELARDVLQIYFAASDIGRKHQCVAPGVGLEQMRAYYSGGGTDIRVSRENIIYSDRHSEPHNGWLSFTLIPDGTFREIRAYVSTEGGRPLLHWPSYVQEKDDFARRVAESPEQGDQDLRIGVCRAASLDGKPRVVLISPGGETLCYAALEVPDAQSILARLEYEKPVSATVTLRTDSAGEKSVVCWKVWGFDRPRSQVAVAEPSQPPLQ